MTSSDQSPKRPATRPSSSRRFVWLAIAIVAAIAVYTGGWFWAAGRVEDETLKFLTGIRDRGQQADCTNAEARGYPFRLGLFCDGVAFSDANRGLSFTGTGLRSAAQIYQPSRIVGELDHLAGDFPMADGAVRATASDMRFSTRVAKPLPELVSVQSGKIDLALPDGQPLGTALGAMAHFRPNGADVDVALSATDITLAGLPQLPPLAFNSDATLGNGVARLLDQSRSLRNSIANIRELSITAPDGAVTISGNIAIDDRGLIDAQLTLGARNLQEIARITGLAIPTLAARIEQFNRILGAMGDNPSIPVAIEKGNVRLGFFTVAEIPPLP